MPRHTKHSESNASTVAPESIRPATTGESRRDAVPEWAPWAALGGLLLAGTAVSLAFGRSAHPGAAHAAASASATLAATPSAPPPVPPGSGGASAFAAGGDAISVVHIVITDRDSVMGKALKITRTKAEAEELAERVLARAKKGEDFSKLVAQFSEEPHTDQSHGVLANFRRKDAIPSFADAAFQLGVGQLSGVVDTPFGYMIILRTK